MTRSVSRSHHLDPFSLDLCELRTFCAKISERFDGNNRLDISVHLPDEILRFKTVEEMIGYDYLPDTIYHYMIRFSDYESGNSCDIHCSDISCLRCTISATADNEGWCADVVETAISFLRKFRTWYFFLFRRAFVTFLALIVPLTIYVIARLLGIISGDTTSLAISLIISLFLELAIFF